MIRTQPHELPSEYVNNRWKDLEMLEAAIAERDFTTTWFIGDRMRAHGTVWAFDDMPVIGLALQQAAEEEQLADIQGLTQRMKEQMETLRVQ